MSYKQIRKRLKKSDVSGETALMLGKLIGDLGNILMAWEGLNPVEQCNSVHKAIDIIQELTNHKAEFQAIVPERYTREVAGIIRRFANEVQKIPPHIHTHGEKCAVRDDL